MSTPAVSDELFVKSVIKPEVAGYLLNWALFGALSVQVYSYHLGFPNDKRFVKFLVYGVYLVEILQTGLTMYQNFSAISFKREYVVPKLSWLSGPVIGAIVACIGQMFYAYRIYVLSSSIYISAIVGLIALLQCAAGITYGVMTLYHNAIPPSLKIPLFLGAPAITWSVLSALDDLIIASYMTYYLRRCNNTAHKSTQLLVKRIVRLTIETGMLTAILQLVLTVGYFTLPYSAPLRITMSKWYSNTILVMLNSRLRTATIRDEVDMDSASPGQDSIWFNRVPAATIMNRHMSQDDESLARSAISIGRNTPDENVEHIKLSNGYTLHITVSK